jgi:hypothetical protein
MVGQSRGEPAGFADGVPSREGMGTLRGFPYWNEVEARAVRDDVLVRKLLGKPAQLGKDFRRRSSVV